MTGDIPFEMEAFRVSFLPSEPRKIRRNGIHLFEIRYWSDALAGHIGRGDGKVVVRYDTRDLSDIWIGFPRAEQVLDRLQGMIKHQGKPVCQAFLCMARPGSERR
ncbi:Mu transposase C-terminal domain-containing protein [uncultured Roseovarius sp.]|uniref:Mu transposase C-terminal domain-containing protein n=1 Tax=uncultured Roseovarius sp. TaxID=293344 RepID=UPI00261A991D|nr:Mu transposase C-terminal domain-containing protein [uncultured Roseovarius sp.]